MIAAFGRKIRKVTLGFAPEDTSGWEIHELREEDCNFFVKGNDFTEFEEKQLRIPSLSHT